ncbi:MAG: xanthine dehydrogenase family protein molybdopterin-binding subunit [Nitrososphaerota archaeon]
MIDSDLLDKLRGVTKYPTDFYLEDILYGKVVRSPHPHAMIQSIDTSKAEIYPGVRTVMTAADIPGSRMAGIFNDIPVLASDRVRYVGEPVAILAAETEDIAEEAASLVRVKYKKLRPVGSIDEALDPHAPSIHENGNIAYKLSVGDTARTRETLRDSYAVVEAQYETGRQKHMYLEPEGGVAWFDNMGILNVVVGGQAPHRDARMIANILNMPEDRVKVHIPFTGGAFGGKDDVTVQAHLALLAWKTRRAVRLVWNREESASSGYSRHPMRIWVKLGSDREGRFTGLEARLVADTGAYRSLGHFVMEVAAAHITGAYRIPVFSIEGLLVFTNNGISSAMRGFGAPQSTFAIERAVYELAQRLGINPIELRQMNALVPGDNDPWGVRVPDNLNHLEILGMMRASPLLKDGFGPWTDAARPWIVKAVGISFGRKSLGIGTTPDYQTVAVELSHTGKFLVRIGAVDYGQGVISSLRQLFATILEVPIEQTLVISSDSAETPDRGSTIASRTISTLTPLLVNATQELKRRILEKGASQLGTNSNLVRIKDEYVESYDGEKVRLSKIAELLGADRVVAIRAEAPRPTHKIENTLHLPLSGHSYMGVIACVEVDTETGAVKVSDMELYCDVGTVINLKSLISQIMGGAVMSLGYSLTEELFYYKGKPVNMGEDFRSYIIPSSLDAPDHIVVKYVTYDTSLESLRARGAGELGMVVPHAAIVNAISRAVGRHLTKIPVHPWHIISKDAAIRKDVNHIRYVKKTAVKRLK